MRRSLVLVLLSLLVTAPVAVAGVGPGDRAADDGTLSVKRGKGLVGLDLRGAAIGRVDSGTVTVWDPGLLDNGDLVLRGCDKRVNRSDDTIDPDDFKLVCVGTDIRFRLDGRYGVLIRGTGIFMSAVGRGRGKLDGRGDVIDGPDGVYSLNGDPYQSLPNELTPFAMTAPTGG